jgi:3-methyladenine DNA glycosylase Mpg
MEEIAVLLLSSGLQVGNHILQIVEIEMYCYSSRHPDPTVHRHPIQKEYRVIYFHRTGSSYRGGTFKGMDLVLGDDDTHFGVLIRSVVDNDKLVTGPCCVVNYILEILGVSSILEICPLSSRLYFDEDPIRLVDLDKPETIYRGSRVGLSAKYPEEWTAKKYRFSSRIKGLKKQGDLAKPLSAS